MEFGILGPLEVREGDRTLALGGARQRALLALLLLHANEVVSSDRILDALWPSGLPGSGASAVQVLVSRLRAALGAGGEQLVTRAPGYVLRLEDGQLDLQRFERLVAAAEADEPLAAARALREALAIWRGPALADLAYETFAQPAITRLEELRLVTLQRRIDADLALGRHVELVGEVERLVAEHPLRESFRGQLMLALYRSGRQAESLEGYKETRRVLVDELGLEPSRALQELEAKILRQDPSLDVSPSAAPERAILVVPRDERRLDAVVALAEPLAGRPRRELLLVRVVSADELGAATSRLHDVRATLLVRGLSARAAAFAAPDPGRDLVRLASEQDVDLLLLDAAGALLDDAVTRVVLDGAPCDVGLFVGRPETLAPGPVLVPFAGAEHDWSAIEIGAWIAGSQDVKLLLAGPRERGRDASRILASASLAVQRAHGVVAEPLLVDPGPGGLVAAADEASLVVAGLSDRWRRDGLGPTRSALAADARPPVVLVRRGLRPGGLAPPATLTRFTWTVGPPGGVSSP